MKTSAIIGITLLAIAWLWLAVAVLMHGVTLMTLLTVIMSGIIVFVPVWRKYGPGSNGKGGND